MALLTAQSPGVGGLTATYSAVNSSDTVTPSAAQLLHVKNGSGSSINVTITDGGFTPGGTSGTSTPVAVANGADKFFFIPPAYQASSTGLITVNYSSVTSVTAALLRIG